ncbi:MAG: hypothetical protein ACOX7J_07055 [Bacillota bacterium]|jgi:hypothetical protein
MVQDMISAVRNDYWQIMKLGALFAASVIVGSMTPSLFSEETRAFMADLSEQLLAGIQGSAELTASGFLSVFIVYAVIMLVLWMAGGSRIGAAAGVAVLLGFGIILGIGLNIVFSLGFAYGVLLFVLSMLPGDALIAVAFILAINNIGRGSGNFLNYTYGFLPSLILIFVACWYLSFAGPFLLNFVISLI